MRSRTRPTSAPGSTRSELISQVASRWATDDVGAAVRWMQQLPEGRDKLTALGRRQLESEVTQFERVMGAIVRVLETS